MPKLFVAIDLPSNAISELNRLQRGLPAGGRWVEMDQMHLTLHHIGNADVGHFANALKMLRFPAFKITINGMGKFSADTGAVTIWAGVMPAPILQELHVCVASLFAPMGFQPECRPYTPHIALARYEYGLETRCGDELVAKHKSSALAGVSVAKVTVYSSIFVNSVPVYRREESVQLLSSDA